MARRRAGHIDRLYGLSHDDYLAMHDEQGGVCAICHEPEGMTYKGKPKALCVDHDHETGKVRGLLCAACNFALGKFRDNPALLRAAADYLEP
ncbi:endonuclease VII domain-containing protein [Nocardioides terrigena]|uniref:endonuclease VII domain-containing protein n=1 Tax=Nocardioides terrigena TaxID=424797 RepID=UPI00131F47FF|nr:endonuclease VII domain-containing protein [Nocardioides terrigena]